MFSIMLKNEWLGTDHHEFHVYISWTCHLMIIPCQATLSCYFNLHQTIVAFWPNLATRCWCNTCVYIVFALVNFLGATPHLCVQISCKIKRQILTAKTGNHKLLYIHDNVEYTVTIYIHHFCMNISQWEFAGANSETVTLIALVAQMCQHFLSCQNVIIIYTR